MRRVIDRGIPVNTHEWVGVIKVANLLLDELERLRAEKVRVVDAFDAYMAPMESGGDSQETWAEVKASIEALRE